MAQLRCPNCQTIFEANTTMPQMGCPHCGYTYNNPYYRQVQPATQPVSNNSNAITKAPNQPAKRGESKFTGGLGSLIGLRITNWLLLIITIGLATPYVICRTHRWRIEHQYIDGYQLYFDGKAGQLFGQWLKWVLLTIITIGIYSFWIPIKKQRWLTEHTHLTVK